jgi:hypothetical protein
MGITTSVTTENPEPRRQGGTSSREAPTAATNIVEAAYSDEQPSRGSWLSEAPPTGVLTGVLSEMAFYYGACWLYHRSGTSHRRTMR